MRKKYLVAIVIGALFVFYVSSYTLGAVEPPPTTGFDVFTPTEFENIETFSVDLEAKHYRIGVINKEEGEKCSIVIAGEIFKGRDRASSSSLLIIEKNGTYEIKTSGKGIFIISHTDVELGTYLQSTVNWDKTSFASFYGGPLRGDAVNVTLGYNKGNISFSLYDGGLELIEGDRIAASDFIVDDSTGEKTKYIETDDLGYHVKVLIVLEADEDAQGSAFSISIEPITFPPPKPDSSWLMWALLIFCIIVAVAGVIIWTKYR